MESRLGCCHAMAGEEDSVEIEGEQNEIFTAKEKLAIKQFLLSANHARIFDESGKQVDEETAVRFLMARKFEVERAIDLFKAHLAVCNKFDLISLNPFQEDLSRELLSGKFTVLFGKDFTGASVCLFTEKLHFPKKTTHSLVLKSLIFQLNEIINRYDVQRNGLVLIYDMTKAAYRNFDYDLCMKTLRILKGAFPARLKHVYILAAPLWLRASLSILSNFIGEKITSRVKILKKTEDLLTRIPASSLPLHLGGSCEHDHDMWLEMCVSNYLKLNENKKTSAQARNQAERVFAKTKSFSDRLREAASEEQGKEKPRESNKLSLGDLVKYIETIGTRGIYEEYHSLRSLPPTGKFSSSQHPFNADKNRYRDVHCYDHTRVKLTIQGEDDFSDYINASFVDGFDHPRAYICTQGPLKNTAADFWRMVLEQETHVILMLSRCFERGKEKCFQYWPEEGKAVKFRSISVRNLIAVTSSDYIARNLEVYNERENVRRRVTHFQFIGWPDYGVPVSAERLLEILDQVRAFQNLTVDMQTPENNITSEESFGSPQNDPSNEQSPMVVHCSAGIGRTGTFVTIDTILHEFDATGTVDIQGTVQSIRRQRAFSVQTEEQYAFCYSALLEYCTKSKTNNGISAQRIIECLEIFKRE